MLDVRTYVRISHACHVRALQGFDGSDIPVGYQDEDWDVVRGCVLCQHACVARFVVLATNRALTGRA
jgi:hypothetical protein